MMNSLKSILRLVKWNLTYTWFEALMKFLCLGCRPPVSVQLLSVLHCILGCLCWCGVQCCILWYFILPDEDPVGLKRCSLQSIKYWNLYSSVQISIFFSTTLLHVLWCFPRNNMHLMCYWFHTKVSKKQKKTQTATHTHIFIYTHHQSNQWLSLKPLSGIRCWSCKE